jgi:hypothetical protein
MALNLVVPIDVAEEITREGLAAWPLETRGDPSVIAVTVSLLGVAANLVTVVASADAVREIAHRVVMWALRRSPEPTPDTPVEFEVTLRDGPTVRVATLSSNDKMAITVLSDDLTRIVVDLPAQRAGEYE